MLDNKFALISALVLLVAAAGYNVWFFFLQGEEGGGGGTAAGGDRPAASAPAGRPGAGAPDAGAASPADSAASRLASLVRAARSGRLPVRSSTEVERVLASSRDRPAWGRDPLARPGTGEPEQARAPEPARQPPSWRLGAVMTGGDRNVAVIDDRVYSEGDEIDGGRVAEIRPGQVVILWRGRRVVLEPDGRP